MRSRRSLTTAALALPLITAALALPFATRAGAQGEPYPRRAIRIVVPLPPGGSPDYLARLLAERLQATLGQPLVVENRPGAGGNIAREHVARQPPDGYTLVMSEAGHVLSAAMVGKLAFDPIKDFEAITLAAKIPFVLAVNPSLQATTIKDFIGLAKARPGALTYGSAGIGSPHHFATELLKSLTAIDIVHVPYKGSAGIIPAMLASEIDFTIGAINSLLPHFRAGKLRPIALAATTRTPVMPELPTIAEAADLPQYGVDIWLGVLAPAGTPRTIVERLNLEINRVMRDPATIRDRLLPQGLDPVGSTPEQFADTMRTDLATYTRVAREAGMKAQ